MMVKNKGVSHKELHDLLGEVTSLRTAVWQMHELVKEENNSDFEEAYLVAESSCDRLAEKVEQLKSGMEK